MHARITQVRVQAEDAPPIEGRGRLEAWLNEATPPRGAEHVTDAMT